MKIGRSIQQIRKMRHIQSVIVSAFPGTGKTTYNACDYAPGNWSSDSDSSKFPKDGFPDNYIEHIKSLMGNVKMIFVSSHKVVRDALVANGIHFTLIYPSVELKEEYIDRYVNRGNNEAFVQLLNDNWDAWISELKEQEGCNHIVLKSNQFISNVL